MSQNNISPTVDVENSVTNEKNDKPEKEEVQWGYSGKAMRAQCFLYWVVTFLLFGGGVYLTITGLLDAAYFWAWIGIVVFAAVLWIQFFATYCYRTWSLRYKLTNHRLYTYQGLFTKTSDSMELVYIEDVQLVQTFFDRVFNGGVGRLVIFSSADKTHRQLVIAGIENPQSIFEKVDIARADVRAKRAIISGS
ncbi:MAG: PH domain-containing protein [Planctomycetaceae bacterium]|jgi:membrane protein YdbS with pleckstrin-like domain|nr:PH domain-containing protein [Planctomycetaceae bacterium]